ncbi:MAG: hypothetical protein H0T71_03380, partial [Acidobacteria bacterium]|nr:hypothetical protein [Acidobacteriota bacterium]
MTRWLAISAMAVMAMVVFAILLLHTNPIQSRILRWSVEELERRFDLDLIADDLQYNLAARRVTMTNVRLAAVGHRDNPFFTATTLTVQLPWAAYRGRLVFDAIDIERGSVTITRDAQGTSNLPPTRNTRDPNAPTRRIDIRGLIIRNLDFLYRDYQRDIEIRTPRIRTDLQYSTGDGAKGPFVIEDDVTIRVRDRRVTMKPVTGQMVFDGSNIELEGVALDTTEGVFTLAGEIQRALDRPNLDLTFKGTADIARASQWARPPVPVAGDARLDARMTGPPSAFVLDAAITANDAEIGRERGVRLDADSRLTLDGIAVSRATIRPATGGEIHATVDAPFGAQSRWWIKANYSNIDAGTGFRLANVNPLPFGAVLTGTAELDGGAGRPFGLRLHNTSTPRAPSGTAPLEGDVEFVIDGSRWRANQRHRMGSTRVDGRIGGTWNRQAASRSTFDGNLAVTTGDVAEAARYAALFGLNTPEIVRGARGPMTAEVTIGGVFTEPRFVGTARTSGIDIPSVGTTVFTARFDASAAALNATEIDATVGASTIRGHVFANLRTRDLTGQLQLEAPSAADLISALPESLRVQGPLSATAVLGGTVDQPDIRSEVSGTGLTINGQAIRSLSGKARIVGEGLNIEGLSLRQPGGGELRATGRYAWNTRTFDVDVIGQDLLWRGTLARLGNAEARIALKFAGAGSIDRPVGEGVVEFAVSGGLAGELVDRGVLNVRLNGETALITGQIPALGAFISATVVPRTPFPYEAVVVMNRIDLAPVVALSGLDQGHMTGTASLSATAKGSLNDVASSNAFINLQDIQADVSGVAVKLVTPARLAWDGA